MGKKHKKHVKHARRRLLFAGVVAGGVLAFALASHHEAVLKGTEYAVTFHALFEVVGILIRGGE
jgi:hypothetical protein